MKELFRHTARCGSTHGGQGECKATITSIEMPDGIFRVTIESTSTVHEERAFAGCLRAMQHMALVRAKEELEGMITESDKKNGVAQVMEGAIEEFIKHLKLAPLPKRA